MESIVRAEFDLASFSAVIGRHNRNIGRLMAWRQTFARHADAMADLLLTYPLSVGAGDKQYWESPARRDHLRDCFAGRTPYQGNARTFDPWNGVWTGRWNRIRQHHLWDETVTDSGGQNVQPVTQSETDYVTADNLEEFTRITGGRA